VGRGIGGLWRTRVRINFLAFARIGEGGVVTLRQQLVETDAAQTIDVSRPADTSRPFVQVLVSLGGAVGVALLVPFVMLLAGLLVALPVRGIVEVIGWLMARIVG